MGFKPELDGEYFSNGRYDIFDALPNNVLVGNDGHLYFIDTIIYKSQDGGFDIYIETYLHDINNNTSLKIKQLWK